MDRKEMAQSLRGRETRVFPAAGLEVRESNGSLGLSGWASVTNRAYDMGVFKETIRAGAFTKTLSEGPDVQLLMNHEGLPLARTVKCGCPYAHSETLTFYPHHSHHSSRHALIGAKAE